MDGISVTGNLLFGPVIRHASGQPRARTTTPRSVVASPIPLDGPLVNGPTHCRPNNLVACAVPGSSVRDSEIATLKGPTTTEKLSPSRVERAFETARGRCVRVAFPGPDLHPNGQG